MVETRRLSRDEALDLAHRACRGAGASEAAAASLAAATLSAEAHGKTAVGFAHLVDYLTSLTEGRIDGAAAPAVSFPAAALVSVDARGGVAQLGFDLAFGELSARAKRYGVAIFAQRNSYTTGELGYYARRLAETDLLSLAVSNGPPLMAPPGVGQAVYCTNPIAFAAPGEGRPALVIDQASSATAFVKLRDAAARGEVLPEGWAIDADGAPTTDPIRALAGALADLRRGAGGEHRAYGGGLGGRPYRGELVARGARFQKRRSIAGRGAAGDRRRASAPRRKVRRAARRPFTEAGGPRGLCTRTSRRAARGIRASRCAC